MKHHFHIENMKCNGCVVNVEKSIASLPGVTTVQVDLEGRSAVVEGEIAPERIIQAISKAGYPTSLQA